MRDPSVARARTPFGAWRSPIGTQLLTAGVRAFGALGTQRGQPWWCEARPDEGGRTTLLRRTADGAVQELLPAPWNARTRVHEYGGGAVCAGDDAFWFVDFRDQQLHRVAVDAAGAQAPVRITAAPDTRFADACHDAARQRLVAVAEVARPGTEPENLLLAIDVSGGPDVAPTVLARGADFYAAPRISPDGTRLAWLQWHHPHMPWDAAQLHVARIAPDGTLGPAHAITAADTESAFQPEWLPDGRLAFVCDRGGWWNPWLWDGVRAAPVFEEPAEYGLPLWSLGTRSYCVLDARRLVAQRITDGAAELVLIDLERRRADPLPSAWRRFGQPCTARGKLWFVGERHDTAPAIVEYDIASQREAVLEGGNRPVDAGYLSSPERIAFAGDRGLRTYAWFYPPRNADQADQADQAGHSEDANPRERADRTDRTDRTEDARRAATAPPLMVLSHGGPTSATSPSLNLRIQYFTSRGWAVVDVDYGGSTGYGRAYRERLRERWGITDVADVVAAVDHLAAEGRIDPARVAIRGSSAGGYTTLAALAFTERFRAGVSYYGIGDLGALARDTHKFESRYTDQLVAPWPAGERVYRERSPIEHLDGFRCPAIFLQGGEDRVVPPNQAEAMAQALRARGLPVAHVVFPEEGHGFRNGGNVRRAMALEYTFLARVFGFTPADPMEPLHIDNLPEQ